MTSGQYEQILGAYADDVLHSAAEGLWKRVKSCTDFYWGDIEYAARQGLRDSVSTINDRMVAKIEAYRDAFQELGCVLEYEVTTENTFAEYHRIAYIYEVSLRHADGFGMGLVRHKMEGGD